jgi:hypothetical protein
MQKLKAVDFDGLSYFESGFERASIIISQEAYAIYGR